MDACLNVSHTNVIDKHIHHDEYANMYMMLKWCQKKLLMKSKKEKEKTFKIFTTCKFVKTCCDKKCNP